MTFEGNEFISDFSRFYILTILYEGPAHGYRIIGKFRKRVGKEISPSLVYPFLKQLERKGLVKHTVKPVRARDWIGFSTMNDTVAKFIAMMRIPKKIYTMNRSFICG